MEKSTRHFERNETTMNRVSINKIFISHSAKDIKIIESFVEHILRLGLDISSERIFCSSMEGHGVRSGRYIPDILRQEIHQSSIALLFISKNYKSSEVCLNELGAAWVTLEKENVIPFLLPDIDFENVGFLDFGRLGLRVNEKGDILRLIQDNKEQLNPSFHLEKLHTHIEKFLETVNSSYKAIISGKEIQLSEESTEWKQCFEDNLYPF